MVAQEAPTGDLEGDPTPLLPRRSSWPSSQNMELFNPEKVGTTRYRYRGSNIPTPWPITDEINPQPITGLVESPVH
jgi:hypothetical protein